MKEAGIAIQTFYKHFTGKDQVLLAVIEDLVSDTCTDLKQRASDLPDPVARLRFYITSVVRRSPERAATATPGRGSSRPSIGACTGCIRRSWHKRPGRSPICSQPEIHAAMEAGLLAPPGSGV